MKTKILKITMIFAMLMLFMPIIANAEIVDSGECGLDGDNVTWTLDDEDTLTISGEGEMKDYYYNTLSSSSSAPWYKKTIKSVIIEDGVTNIGDYAFDNRSSLTSITIPNSVKSIGDYAFDNCSSLTSITIPDSITSIGSDAFYGCNNLQEITLPFIGSSRTNNNSYSAVFGYIFGCTCTISSSSKPSSSSNGGVLQYTDTTTTNGTTYYGYYYYYIPTSLRKVTITDTNQIPYQAFYNCGRLISVTIPGGVTSIGNSAFHGCSSITSITIPDSATSIGNFAFHGCSSLTSITIPDRVTSIGNSAFYGCSSLKDVYITSLEWWLENVSKFLSNPMSYANNIYVNGELAKNIIIPDNINEIKASTFSGWSCLENIIIPDRVTSIGNSAFHGCSSLTSITIPDRVTSIGDSAFHGCSSLTSITIPDRVTSIGNASFYGCSSLEKVYYNAKSCTTTIPSFPSSSHLFENCTSLKEVYIGNTVEAVPAYVFYGCSSITSVTIGKGIISIGYNAFGGCSGLKDVHIISLEGWLENFDNFNSNPMSYANNIYVDGELAKNIIIPYSITEIKANTFSGWSCLESITIPDSVTSISSSAFSGCKITALNYNAENYIPAFGNLLTEIHLGNNVKTIPQNAFSSTAYYKDETNWENGVLYIDNWLIETKSDITEVSIKEECKAIADSAFAGCSSLDSIYISDLAAYLNMNFGNNTSSPMYYANKLYLNGKRVTSFDVPDSVTKIPFYAFAGCDSLKKITLSESVTDIQNGAFSNCSSLTNIIIPDKVTSIGDYAFSKCAGLTRVNIPDSVETIGTNAFSNCSGLNNIIIGNGVTSIGSAAFYGCSELTSVKIPNGVTRIEQETFANCSKLETVTISDSVTNIDWGSKYYSSPFYGCRSLKSIDIPNGITNISRYAFDGCSSLTSITIPESVTSIDYSAFERCSSLKNVYISSLDWWLDNCNNFSSYLMNYADNIYVNGVLVRDLTIPGYYKEIQSSAFSGWNCLESVTIPNTVTNISANAFSGCNNLIKVYYNAQKVFPNIFNSNKNNLLLMVLGDNVANIDENAFTDCNELKRILIPKSVTEIEKGAFSDCSKLTTIEYGGSQLDWNEIYIGAENENLTNAKFVYNSSLANTSLTDLDYLTYTKNDDNTITITDCNTAASNIDIPTEIDGLKVTAIGYEAFDNCRKLTTITIPNSIKSIGSYAFYDCDNLKDVYFTGTEKQWKAIDIGYSNSALTNANIHYNETAPEPTPTPTPTYTIKYDANGGSGAPSSQSVKSCATITVSSQIPKRTGYDFLGWSASKTAETATYNAGDSITVISNLTLYAVWSKIPMPDTTGNEITISDAKINDNIVSFTLKLDTTHTIQGTILVGVYADDGTLTNIMSYPAEESNDISFTKQDNDSTVKVFWWYDSNVIFPMAKNAELMLTDENAL